MIFLDVNIFVDILNNRDKWYGASARILNDIRNGKEDGCISALTVPILWYVLGENSESIKAIRAIIKGLKIIPMTSQIINESFSSQMIDFEDAIQMNSALKGGASVLITRNKKDFTDNAKLDILTPEEFLAQ